MNPASAPTDGSTVASKRRSGDRSRYFYAGAAALLLLFVFLGFHLFYLKGEAYPGRPLTPPIRTLVILHGVGMTLWMLLFFAQTCLVATKRVKVHMTLGWFGVILAAYATVTGVLLAMGAARVNPPQLMLWGLDPRHFMAVPLTAIATFAVLVGIGIWKRKNREVHRPMMLLAMLAAIPAALDRIGAIRDLYAPTIWGAIFGPYFSTFVIGLVLLALNWALTRRLDRWLAVGYAALVVIGFLVMRIAPTPIWTHFEFALLR